MFSHSKQASSPPICMFKMKFKRTVFHGGCGEIMRLGVRWITLIPRFSDDLLINKILPSSKSSFRRLKVTCTWPILLFWLDSLIFSGVHCSQVPFLGWLQRKINRKKSLKGSLVWGFYRQISNDRTSSFGKARYLTLSQTLINKLYSTVFHLAPWKCDICSCTCQVTVLVCINVWFCWQGSCSRNSSNINIIIDHVL